MAIDQPCFSPRTTPARNFGVPFRLNADDGGTRPASTNLGRYSVSPALSHIAFQTDEGVRRTFQRGRPQKSVSLWRRGSLKLSCFLSASSTRARIEENQPRTGKPDLTRGTLQL